VIDSAVILGAVGGILLIERGLHSAASVVDFLTVAAVVDLWSMRGGLTRTLLDRYREGSGDLFLYLTLVVPVNGQLCRLWGSATSWLVARQPRLSFVSVCGRGVLRGICRRPARRARLLGWCRLRYDGPKTERARGRGLAHST
jgi:hypothetical protein